MAEGLTGEAYDDAVAKHMMNNLELKDRTYCMKVYKHVFTGKDAVKFMVERGYAKDVADAVALGQRLQKKDVIYHVANERDFLDADYFYTFKDDRLLGVDDDYIKAVADQMQKSIEIKDRSYRMKSYKQCFVGMDAVRFLVSHGYARNVEAAELVGNRMMKMGIFRHVAGLTVFENGDLYYRFAVHEQEL